MSIPVRYLLSILANGALLLGFMQAPSMHVHQHEATERHAGSVFHFHTAHFESHRAPQIELRDLDPDDDAQFLNWFSATPTGSGLTPIVLIGSIVPVSAPEVTVRRTFTFRPSAHDPPSLTTTTPRAPPTV